MAGLLTVGSSGVAEAGTWQGETCRRCDSAGRVANPYWTEHGDEEEGVTWCSVVLDKDPEGVGHPTVPCSRCRCEDLRAKAEREVAARKEALVAWVEERRHIDQDLRVEMVHLRTPHFLLSWVPPRIKAARGGRLDAHQAAHLFARRLEGFYRDFQTLLGIDDKRMRNTLHQVLVFDRLKDMSRACEIYLSMVSDTSAKLAGDPSYLITWWDKVNIPDDRALDRHLTHHVTHLLSSVFHLKRWLQPQAFLDEGMAHWFEVRYFHLSANSCNAEEVEEDFSQENWYASALQAVRSKDSPSLVDLLQKDTFQLKGRDHFLAFALFDFLMSRGADHVRDLMVRLKNKEELRDALEAEYGLSPFGLQEECLAWVLEHYPALARPGLGRGEPDPSEVLRGLVPPPEEEDGGAKRRR